MRRTWLLRGSPLGWASWGSLVGVVASLTLAIRGHEIPLSAVAASAAKISVGRVWLLPASGLVVDRPVYVGLVAFGLLGIAALVICGTRIFWVAAVTGHIGSTLAVYAIIGASRQLDPHAFASAFARQDFGVSAMQGAWVGAVAATAWSRVDGRARALVAAGVCGLGGIAWWLHPDPSILTTEHLFAFLIGCAVVSWPPRASSVQKAIANLAAAPRRDATTAV
ncbi:MAG TPA: hypothetical protein VLJ44_03000 [Gaiellaceae bacterium]|nr:hypothetical protein [Gaiellaceae bacterium]